MKEKIFSVIMLTLLLISMLNLAFMIKPLCAKSDEGSMFSKDFLKEKGEAALFKESSMVNQIKDFDTNWRSIFESKPEARQDEALESSGQTSREDGDKWNFNDTTEWSNFAYMDGDKTRLIVGVNGENPESLLKLEKIAAKHQAKIVNTISIAGEIRAAVVELLLVAMTSFVEEIRVAGLASYIEPNMKVQAQFVPNDPYWSLQWGPQKIEADWAWNITIGDPAVLVAVVDTGIYYTHPDLAANYAPLGYDWVNNDADPIDDHGHGTHCAGIIAAVLNNGIGIAGLAQVRVMAEKVLTSWGWGYWDWVASGIIHATDSGADIISMSLGGYGYSILVHEAVKYAYDSGVLVIAAAGNENTNTKLYPAGFDEVIAVAATDQYDYKAWWSNWGDWIELAAPGVSIFSTVPWGYEPWSGTSMACPHVSGVAALVWSRYPNKTRDWVRLWLRYTADDLGDPGFDVYYGHGRINARKAVEQAPPAHELIAYEWITPPYVKPGAIGTINATVLNFGESDETNITVQLLANGTVVDSVLIGFLASVDSTTISLAWNPAVEGLYNVTFYVVPVSGEASLENNVLWKHIYVGFPVKAVVLHSAGNIHGDIITNWQVLNSEWHLFGNTMVYIDYATLNKEGITYEDIANTEADVLIISCAYNPLIGWEFTDSEIEAIKQYVYEGHGLIVTAGTFYYWVPNNNKLAPLLGLNETVMWTATGTDLLHLINTTHPLFNKVPNPLVFPQVGTALPNDGRWDQNELVDGKYLALGHYRESAIVVRRGLVYISPWLEIIPAYYRHHLQLLYNAITWSRYQKPQHELAVFLEAPTRLQPGESALLNATVSNLGRSNETGVELQLLINGFIVDSVAIPELLVDTSYTLSYLWTPLVADFYNITAYAPPVLDEELIGNNLASKMIRVSYIPRILVVDTPQPEDTGALERIGYNYTIVSATRFATVDLYEYNVLFVGWIPGDIVVNALLARADEISEWVAAGNGIVALSQFQEANKWAWLPLWVISSWGFHEDTVRILNRTHPVMHDLTDAELSRWGNSYHGYFISYDPAWEALAEGVEAGKPITLAATYGCGRIVITHQDPDWHLYYEYERGAEKFLRNMIEWVNVYIQYEHDLAVTLDAPKLLKPGDSVLVNTTVRNRGLNNETDVELQLLIDGAIVNSTVIAELPVGKFYTLSYFWIPTIEGTYNVTAYAPPVPGEEYAGNNVATKIVSVRPVKYVLFDQTHGTDNIAEYIKWVTSLTERGYVVEAHTFGPITPDVLKRYDVFVIPQAHYSYTADELLAIRNFVFNGGGLLVIGDDNPWIYTDLTSFAGITWASGGVSGITTAITPHAVTTGVKSVYLDAPIAIMYVAGVAQDLVKDPEGNIMLAVSEQPSGKVIGFADEGSLWNYAIDQADNLRLANNMIDWLAIPIRYKHDLAISLEAPAFMELGNSTVLSATVWNRGLNNETGLELYLMINGTVVSSAMIPELLVGESYTINYVWTPTGTGNYNITAYAPPVPEEEYTANNILTKRAYVFFYKRLYLPHEWVGAGNPMGWHADDECWQYTLPFDFPFYGANYRTIYISSNGLITFIGSDSSYGNSIPDLAGKLAIAPAWDDWVTYSPYNIYIWQNSTHVGIRWYVRAYGSSTVANFEAILCVNGIIQFNYAYNNGPVSATIGISNGAGHILAEDATSLNYINTIVFLPYPGEHDVAVIDVVPYANEVKAGDTVDVDVVVENQGNFTETFTVTAYAVLQGNSTPTTYALSSHSTLPIIYVDPPEILNLPPSSTFTISVKISNVTGLYGFDLRFRWSPELLEYVSHSVRVPRDIYPDGVLWNPVLPIMDEVDATAGTYWIAYASLHPAPSFNGSGTFFNMTFHVKGVGSCYLSFDRTEMATREGMGIPHNVQIGYFSNLPPPPPPPPIYVIGTAVIPNLAPGERITLTLTWNTTDVLPGNYVIYAEATGVSYEGDREDNVFYNGIITVVPGIIRDVAILDVTAYPTAVYAGRIVNITAVAKNEGEAAETFNVTVYANTTKIGTQTVHNLASGENITLTFSWNTTGLVPCNNFTIWAEASIVPSETNTTNNKFLNGQVYIKRIGDINGDGKVDIYDVVMVCIAYKSRPGDPHWNPNCDLAHPWGLINIYDVVSVCFHYEEGC